MTSGSRRPAVMRVLRDASAPLSISQIADRLGVHPNTVRFHLDRLVEAGQVERVESDRRTAGRPPQLFRAARRMDPAGPRRYRLLADILVQNLASDPAGVDRVLAAGRAWGRRAAPSGTAVDPVGGLIALLDDMGFAPEKRDDRSIGLRNCPFLELAEDRPGIVCSVHLGLMQGALEEWRSPVTVDRLKPFVEPDLCVAHLAPAGEA